MSDLAEFLLARIAEDEQAARAVTTRQPIDEWDAIGAAGEDEAARSHWGVGSIARAEPTPAARDISVHIARWDPARVLAECEAKRRIVAEIVPSMHEAIDRVEEEFLVPWEHPDSEGLLRRLALPYRSHPDYRDEWAPDQAELR